MGNPTMKFHPHTGEPIVPLWIRPDGRAMWPILGASPDDPPADPPPADPPTDPPADPPAPTDPPADPEPGKGGKDAILADLVKERGKRQGLETELQTLKEAQQGQLDAIAKALGLKDDDTPPDPTKLAEQISEEQSKTAASARQVEIYRLAALGKHEGNPVALLDSANFLASLKDVDPTDEVSVLEAINSAIEKNPSLKAAKATPPFGGGPRPPAPTQAGTLGDAIRNRVAGTR